MIAALAAALTPWRAQAQDTLAPPAPAESNDITPPRLTQDAPAVYPQAALDAHFRDPVSVLLVLDVDTAGAVKRARVEAAAGHGFDEAALAAASKLRFAPAVQRGRPIAARFRFRYTFRPPSPQLAGRAASRVTDAPVAGAQVEATGSDGVTRTTTTGADGAWKFADLPPGKVHVRITAKGRAPEELDEVLEAGQETRVVLRLALEAETASTAPIPSGAPLSPAGGPAPLEVEVTADKPPREVTKRTLDKSEIALIPGTNGDALKSLLSLPGVARPPPLSGQLAVRGSAPADTQVFVGGTGIPLLYHFGGLSSVVPTELLEKIDFYPGNYSAMYGRGTGGLVDIGLRSPKTDGYHGFAQLDLIDARLLVEGPIAGGWSFLAAGRRSWFDLWLGPILQKAGADVTVAPRYYDYQAVLKKDIDAHSSFRLSFFGSDDLIEILGSSVNTQTTQAQGFSQHMDFWRLQARYDDAIDDRTDIKAVAAVGYDIQDTGSGATFRNTTEVPVSGRVELSRRVVHGVTANTGFDLSFIPYKLDVQGPPSRAPGVADNGPGDVPLTTNASGWSALPGMYTEWEVIPRIGTRIVPGLRADYSSPSKTWDLSPRLVVLQDLRSDFPRTVVKAGIGVFYEPPTPMQVDPVFGTPGLLDSRDLQLDAGLEQDFTRQLGLTVDVFYKAWDRLIVQGQTGSTNSGTGRAFGSEFLLRYKADERFFGWLSYTISRSERRNAPGDALYLFQYDEPQVLTLLGSYALGNGWRVGARFQITSGLPFTPNGQGAFDATAGANLSVASSQLDSTRLPLFHELDVRIDRTWKFPRWQLTWYLDIENVYSYQAPAAQTYNYNFTQSSYVNGLPILPSIGLRGEL